MSEPHLVAHVCGGKPHWTIAYHFTDGWFDAFDNQIWPYHSEPLDRDPLPIPAGWLEHLEFEAMRWAAQHKAPTIKLTDLIPPAKAAQRFLRR